MEFAPLSNLSLRKSNDLVSAKYKSSLLENQIMAIALTRIEATVKDDKTVLEAKLYPFELRQLIGAPSHISRTLAVTSKRIVGHNIFVETPTGGFKVHAIITDAEYEDGVFTIRFNDKLRSHILNLEGNFTTYQLAVLTNFNSNGAFRIYELLKSEIYKSDPKVNDGKVEVEYGLAEFRFMIGIANSDDETVKNAVSTMKNIDWDSLYEKLDKKDKKYERWPELRRNVLIPAMEELKEKSDISFEFEGKYVGHAIKKIKFTISPNKPRNEESIKSRQKILKDNAKKTSLYKQLEFPEIEYEELFGEFVGHNGLTEADINMLLSKTRYDEEAVRSAIRMADQQTNISNYMGWLIKCCEQGWAEPIEVVDGSAEKAEKFKEIKKASENPEIRDRVWESIRAKDDYPQFLADSGLTDETIEVIYGDNSKAKVELYTSWKVENFNN